MEKKFTLAENSEYGRFMIASQDIHAGELILDELPLISGPVFSGNLDHHYPSSEINDQCQVCPVCCASFIPFSTNNEESQATRCIKCNLSCCSPNCATSSIHSSQECWVLQELPESEVPTGNPAVMYQFINVIRGIFVRVKGGHHHEWTQVSQLQSKVSELEKAGVFSPYNSLFRLLKWEYFMKDCSKKNETVIPEESINSVARQCLGVMRTNAFSAITNQVSREGLYFLSSLMAHSCLPNTDRQFELNGIRMVTRAAVPIAKGEVITTSYLSLMNGTHERHFETTKTWLFMCKCSRCEDPTEHGTFLSTVACPKCAKLSLQPYIRESTESTLTWKCTNLGECTYVESSSSSNDLPDSLRLVEDAKVKINLRKDIEDVEKWLDTYDNGKFIHTNHSTFAQVKLYLCQYYGREKELGELDWKRLLRKASYCLQISKIMAIVFQGVSLLKGIILFELWCSLKEVKRRADQPALISSVDLISPGSLGSNVQLNYCSSEINRIKAESLDILKYALDNSPEESMAQIMQAD